VVAQLVGLCGGSVGGLIWCLSWWGCGGSVDGVVAGSEGGDVVAQLVGGGGSVGRECGCV
jgi:hypothetical protein